MTTFLLIWYACGWASVSCWALAFSKLSLTDFACSILMGPLALFVDAIAYLTRFGEEIILWRKP